MPHLVVHHSPTGFEWGYGGSGPADTAMNMIEAVLQNEGFQGPREKCWKGTCFAATWRVYQDAKWQFIAPMPAAGGKIAYAEVMLFLADKNVLKLEGVDEDKNSDHVGV